MSDDLVSASTLARVAMEKHMVEARAANLKLRIERGELVRLAAAEAVLYAMAIRIRDQLLTVSSRHAALLAAKYGVDAHKLSNALDGVIRNALTALADSADQLEREKAHET